MSAAPDRTGAFFGRRKGKRLRSGQDELIHSLLPNLRVQPGTDFSVPFAGPDHESRAKRQVWLEIGFGGGEHLAAQARLHPEIGIIGCEPFVNGMAKMLAVIDKERLRNIRLWDDDVADLLPILPEALLDRVYILYPDPWPKRRNRKRRLISDDNLKAIARVMQPGAELRFATDIDDYAGWALARILRSPDFQWDAAGPEDWRTPWPYWASTRYESKALREGRTPSYLTFRRV